METARRQQLKIEDEQTETQKTKENGNTKISWTYSHSLLSLFLLILSLSLLTLPLLPLSLLSLRTRSSTAKAYKETCCQWSLRNTTNMASKIYHMYQLSETWCRRTIRTKNMASMVSHKIYYQIHGVNNQPQIPITRSIYYLFICWRVIVIQL